MIPSSKLLVIDEYGPETTAMMSALYSRSAESVTVHVEKVMKSGSGKFMSSFYVGYGHESIGDCGTTTIYIEGVSMLAAKAIQDWPLYSGQETSTRYIDMSKQAIEDPLGTPESAEILKRWMDFYVSNQEAVVAHLKTIYPRRENEEEKMYEKAIKARSFDVMRCYLPSGVTTQLAWHTNLRQAAKKLALLNHHPDAQIRELAAKIHEKLVEKYPDSFSHKLYEATETYRHAMMEKYTYFDPTDCPSSVTCRTTIRPEELKEYADTISTRPPKTELPLFLLDLGLITFEFPLDFGSFRDLQRHRNGVCRMPLVTTRLGFHPWYLEQLPSELRTQAEALIREQTEAIAKLDGTPVQKQYYIAMGFRVPCRVTYGLPATVYTLELRTGKTVHPTMRRVAQDMVRTLKEQLPGLVIHADLDQDDWDVRRGAQDIISR